MQRIHMYLSAQTLTYTKILGNHMRIALNSNITHYQSIITIVSSYQQPKNKANQEACNAINQLLNQNLFDNSKIKMRSYNEYERSDSESKILSKSGSESDISSDKQQEKAAVNYGKITKMPISQNNHHSDSEQSSLSQDESDNTDREEAQRETRKPNEKVAVIRHQSDSQQDSEEEEESSIDHIEERIKKLEKDLEKRIDKHKQNDQRKGQQSEQSSNQKLKPVKNAGSPPLPKKIETKAPPKYQNQRKNSQPGSENRNKLNIQIDEPNYEKKNDHKPIIQYAEQQKQSRERHQLKQSPKKKAKIEVVQPKAKTITHAEKKKAVSKNNKREEVEIKHNNPTQFSKIRVESLARIQKLESVVEKLREENQKLKRQLAHQSKKKPLEELDKLKEISQNKDVKLQKQIQLLKVIETLQTKLKKSIQKKLNKNRTGNGSSSLLHKGLPSSLLT